MVPTENPENLGTWDQNMLFLAEISGDFHCMDGGVEKIGAPHIIAYHKYAEESGHPFTCPKKLIFQA